MREGRREGDAAEGAMRDGEGGEDGPNEEVISQPESSSSSSLLLSSLELSGTTIYEP